MRTQITDLSVKLWLNASDTDNWANRHNSKWPCSMLAGSRLFAEFHYCGLVDYVVDERYCGINDCIPADEFNAITSDFLKKVLPRNHALYFITVGQFSPLS